MLCKTKQLFNCENNCTGPLISIHACDYGLELHLQVLLSAFKKIAFVRNCALIYFFRPRADVICMSRPKLFTDQMANGLLFMISHVGVGWGALVGEGWWRCEVFNEKSHSFRIPEWEDWRFAHYTCSVMGIKGRNLCHKNLRPTHHCYHQILYCWAKQGQYGALVSNSMWEKNKGFSLSGNTPPPPVLYGP